MQPVTVAGPDPALRVPVGQLAAGLATLVTDQVMVHLPPTFDTRRALHLFSDVSFFGSKRALSLVVTSLFLSSLASGAVIAALDIRTIYLVAGLLLILVVATAAWTSRTEAATDEQPAGPAVDDD